MSLLEQDTIRKKRVDKALSESKKDLEFQTKSDKKYEIEVIIDNAVYR